MNKSEVKLGDLRKLMKISGIDVYLIPSNDPHLGEYVPDHWGIIGWLTGFTGSAGTVVVTELFAGLWTDSRYFIQAERQLEGSGFVPVKPGQDDNKSFVAWINDNVISGSKIALDGRIFSIARTRMIENSLAGKNVVLDVSCDLITGLWTDRTSLPVSMGFDHPVRYCGKDRAVKISEVRELMRQKETDYMFLSSVDDIMWLLNIRGSDIRYSPLLISFAIVGQSQVLLFIEESKIPLKLASVFDNLGIVVLPYEETAGMLTTLPPQATILLDPSTTSSKLFNSIPAGMKIIEEISIPARLKAVKNSVEIENINNAMVRDGIALIKFFYWLEHSFDTENLSELTVAEKLNMLRAENADFLSPSFSTIVAFREHGALPHYTPTTDSNLPIDREGILLIDSGGQYLYGTTDITRTIVLGRPTDRQKRDFSLVLKGTISLAMAKFPEGTRGSQLDILARRALWNDGLDYGHGTGHGVGFCLNVHEGPQNIGRRSGASSEAVIEAGMLISDEPAVYREGEYGIRIENLILCYEDEETEFGKFLKFDTVSLCYIDKSLIDFSLLDQKEKDWLNAYHSEVFEKLSPHLTSEEIRWLEEKTAAF